MSPIEFTDNEGLAPEAQPKPARVATLDRSTSLATKSRVAVVAATEREIAPLVSGWGVDRIGHEFKSFPIFVGERATVICAGMGWRPAEIAAELALQHSHADILISAGFAGGLVGGLSIGGPYTAGEVVDAASGKRYRTLFGQGVLVSVDRVLGSEDKAAFHEQYGASAVDMEAAAVAEVAERRGVGFLAVKAVSEEHDFPMPPLGNFIDARGEFHNGRFLAWSAVRPGSWGTVWALRRNTALAAETLSGVLSNLLKLEDLRQAHPAGGKLVLKTTFPRS